MTSYPDWWKLLFGRFTLEAIPYHEPILIGTFAAVVLGGLGTAYGALVGSIIVGLLVELSTLWIPSDVKYVGPFVVLIIVLMVRPQGLLGRRERIG